MLIKGGWECAQFQRSSGFGDGLWGRMRVFSFYATIRCVLKVLKKEGTVVAAPNFNASGDAAILDKAIKVKGEAVEATLAHVGTWFGFFWHFWTHPCSELLLQLM